jgi:hypothetical protein
MSDDRNEGECYGPFHAGEDCANRIRALESEKAALESRVERLESIHHVQCSLVQGADICDCSLNPGRVWMAKAYNGAASRAEKAEADLAAEREHRVYHCTDIDCERAAGRVAADRAATGLKTEMASGLPAPAAPANDAAKPAAREIQADADVKWEKERDPDDERECAG